MGNLPAFVKIPLWARAIGAVRAVLRERRDRKLAIERHQTLVYVGSIVGVTHWTDTGVKQRTHLWELYEAPNGLREARFTKTNRLACDEGGHPAYANAVLPWKKGLVDIQCSTEDPTRYGIRRKRVEA